MTVPPYCPQLVPPYCPQLVPPYCPQFVSFPGMPLYINNRIKDCDQKIQEHKIILCFCPDFQL